jgi:hypothetical protein
MFRVVGRTVATARRRSHRDWRSGRRLIGKHGGATIGVELQPRGYE